MATRQIVRLAIVSAVVLAQLTVAPLGAQAALRSRAFQTPSGNIGCLLAGGHLRCDILSGLNPEPNRPCELDWTGLSIGREARARPVCAGDTVFDRNSPVLNYGEKWRRGGIVCVSRQSGLRCHNNFDHGFFLSRDDWEAH
ncbi:MAG: hypothetical protein QOG54_2882 [Actinomycetota bacterium]|jgi:hypothetical protein|nr:hypothetical protein [Actinomycetota bacterium]